MYVNAFTGNDFSSFNFLFYFILMAWLLLWVASTFCVCTPFADRKSRDCQVRLLEYLRDSCMIWQTWCMVFHSIYVLYFFNLLILSRIKVGITCTSLIRCNQILAKTIKWNEICRKKRHCQNLIKSVVWIKSHSRLFTPTLNQQFYYLIN
jgi:hypothetical protein